MKLENAELKHIERIVAISKAAFDSDIHVGASEAEDSADGENHRRKAGRNPDDITGRRLPRR